MKWLRCSWYKHALEKFQDFIENENTILVVHNSDFDIVFINIFKKIYNKELKNKFFDTLIIARLKMPHISHCLSDFNKWIRFWIR